MGPMRTLAVGLLGTLATSLASAAPAAPDGPAFAPLSAYERPADSLAWAAACAQPGAPCEARPYSGWIGVKGAEVAWFHQQTLGGCAEDDGPITTATGKVTATGLTPQPPAVAHGPCEDEACWDARPARVAQAVAAYGRRGFTPLSDLRVAQHTQPAGIQMHAPQARLGAPLLGYVLRLTPDDKARRLSVWLDPPAGEGQIVGTVPMHLGYGTNDEGDDIRAPARFGSIGPVVAADDRLLLFVDVHDGGHCSDARRTLVTAPLPPPAAAPLPPPAAAPLPPPVAPTSAPASASAAP